ncbi:succinoglycan biosynthesis protein ExoV [Arsukibacterium tuosuense]|uniref:Succinoglycan biosynthesis protein ExoV n=1 Tax=Arsukibacterium tuosuense TaxID=1323745 RepID=A0A285IUI1_9GAMM|nr:polysaccharide pyruvyl transferase family protein [Arsukibacterium tuosuense]SNY51638.1 succinoglycan biosynthesis protein ExoV [Arsukibacterium tuosuense]
MKLYYFKDDEGNFGDDLNPWLWQQLFPNFFNDSDEELFVGVGTLLNHRIPAAPAVTIFGSGHGYGQLPSIDSNWRFYCVRGPLTAKTLGLPAEIAITDPASLAPLFHKHDIEKKYKISFMPHCESARLGDWATVCKLAGINYLDPRKPFLEVFDGIRQSETLLTEAMHGAILADSFRVPWIPVKAYDHISEYKWQDWLQSVQVEANFSSLKPVWRGDYNVTTKQKLKNILKRRLQETPLWRSTWDKPPKRASNGQHVIDVTEAIIAIANNSVPKLSAQHVFDRNTSKLIEKVDLFKKDHGI